MFEPPLTRPSAGCRAAFAMVWPMHFPSPGPTRRGHPITLDTITSFVSQHEFMVASIALAFALAIAVIISSTWIIHEDQSGLVIKKYGPPLGSGRLVALNGEAGYQARLLAPGWHFVPFRWQYSVVKVPMLVVAPGEIALVVAADGSPIPPQRILGKEVPCSDFQDAEAFLRGGGERGRQLAFLTAGTYRINPSLFEVITARTAQRHDIEPETLRVRQVPPEAVGIVTTLDGRPIPAGDLAGPSVEGHDSFQRGQKFVEAG